MKQILIILSLFFISVKGQSQSLKDSINVLYKNYFQLLKSVKKTDSLTVKIKDLRFDYQNFEDLLESNNKKINRLTAAELFSLKNQLNQKRKKIINTPEFVFSANASLNAIKQLDATSDYLGQISNLNNPENSDLGFSLSKKIESILYQKIIKGNKKINGVKASKISSFVNNIIKSPITEVVSTAIPVVSSIKSVINLVMGNALRGNDVSINDIIDLKKSLKVYLDHYEGLAKSQSDFEQNLGNLDIRKEGLILLLTQYTLERINTLSPNLDINKELPLTTLINTYYSTIDVQQRVDIILNKDTINHRKHLNDKRLFYPNYALNQAKFIRDEIESLGKEYISIFKSYQLSLKQVLENSKTIGDDNKVNIKIKELEIKLKKVEDSFKDNLNIDKLNQTFKTLSQY